MGEVIMRFATMTGLDPNAFGVNFNLKGEKGFADGTPVNMARQHEIFGRLGGILRGLQCFPCSVEIAVLIGKGVSSFQGMVTVFFRDEKILCGVEDVLRRLEEVASLLLSYPKSIWSAVYIQKVIPPEIQTTDH